MDGQAIETQGRRIPQQKGQDRRPSSPIETQGRRIPQQTGRDRRPSSPQIPECRVPPEIPKRQKTDQEQTSDQTSDWSGASLKSDRSKWEPENFRPQSGATAHQSQSGLSGASLKSDRSKWEPENFCPEPGATPPSQSGFSGVSLKSDHSKRPPLNFSTEPGSPSQVQKPEDLNVQTQLDEIFTRLEEDIVMFVKEELRTHKRLLDTEYPESASQSEEEQTSKEAMLNITMDFLRKIKQEQLAERLQKKSTAPVYRHKLKSHMRNRFSQVFEGVAKAGNSTPLHQIYTELYITEGGASEVNQEHEVRHIEVVSGKPAESPIACEDIFIQQPDSEGPVRTVLTKGVAGVGKTVLTQKFSLDWAEGKANQDIQLLFPFTFRELNVLRDRQFSLMELLHHFFSETKELCSLEHLKMIFILDGLDECRLPLDFSRTRVLTVPTESASVEELLVNLVRGNLLPSARLWITTRPAAANQIPVWCISLVTEVQGFTNPQKEEYFRKRFSNEQQATAVISHIKTIRSLYIMCYMPIFCWILSSVIQMILEQPENQQLPKTLTEMYIHFLVVQAKIKNIKYDDRTGAELHWTPATRNMVWSLAKLAFEQLLKGNLIFYESDLSECGLDADAASMYSGVFTQVFREEQGLYQDKVYCFIHLSVQEFLAALHVHQTFFSSGVNLLSTSKLSEGPEAFYRSAVDRAFESPNGHLDLFLRFLLGLSLPTNQSLLRGLLPQTEINSQTKQETVEYIREKLNEDPSMPRSINLLHCLNELKESSLVEEIENLSKRNTVSPGEWSDLSLLLLSSASNLEEFDLRQYQASETALFGLLPAVKASTKAILSSCNLSPLSCISLASVLSSSSLTHLDLSNNNLQDSGVEQLCFGLKSSTCRLQTLSLSGCMVSERGGAALASALSSSSSHLRALDLSYNHLGPSAKLLTALRAPHGSLDSLILEPAGARWLNPGLQKYYSELTLDQNKVNGFLQLSGDRRTVTSVREEQPCPEHAERFEWPQILSASALSGRCYWEVEWSGGVVDVAVSYRGIQRKGKRTKCEFGTDHQSWTLRISVSGFSVRHNNIETALFSSSWSGPSDSPCAPHPRISTTSPIAHLNQLNLRLKLRRNRLKRLNLNSSNTSTDASHPSHHSFNPSCRLPGPSSRKLLRNLSGLNRHSSSTSACSSKPSPQHSCPSPLPSSPGSRVYSSGRIGVLLDSESLSFFDVSSGSRVHLYTFNTVFTEPVFAGFWLWNTGSTVSLVEVTESPQVEPTSTT